MVECSNPHLRQQLCKTHTSTCLIKTPVSMISLPSSKTSPKTTTTPLLSVSENSIAIFIFPSYLTYSDLILVGSSRKAQKIQIHMKNNRFHNRKASGPAHLNAANAATSNLQNKQFILAQKGQSNVSQERIPNYEGASSIQQ